jgi:hypothetical protein
MTEQFRPLLDPNRRPLFPSEKKIWKIKHEPRIIESNPMAEWEEMRRRSAERYAQAHDAPFWYLLLCGLLSWLDGFGIDGEGKIETPQDTLTAKS